MFLKRNVCVLLCVSVSCESNEITPKRRTGWCNHFEITIVVSIELFNYAVFGLKWQWFWSKNTLSKRNDWWIEKYKKVFHSKHWCLRAVETIKKMEKSLLKLNAQCLLEIFCSTLSLHITSRGGIYLFISSYKPKVNKLSKSVRGMNKFFFSIIHSDPWENHVAKLSLLWNKTHFNFKKKRIVFHQLV